MAYDPLALATRKTRTALLVFGAATLSIELFQIAPETLPLLGTDIPTPELFLPFVFGIGSVFLFLSFLFYAYDDMRHVESKKDLRNRKVSVDKEIAVAKDRARTLERTLATKGGTLQQRHKDAMQRLIDNHRDNELTLGRESRTLDDAIKNYSVNPISWIRFWIIDLGIPIALFALVVMGWYGKLDWLREIMGIGVA